MIIRVGRDAYVGGVSWDITEEVLGGDGDHVSLHFSWSNLSNGKSGVGGRLEGEEVGQKTADVGRGHGSSGDGVDGMLASDPGGLDVQARSEDVGTFAEVGEVSTLISKSRGADGDGVLRASRRVVASISVIVTGSNGKVHANSDSLVNNTVQSDRFAASQAHVSDTSLEALSVTLLGLANRLQVAFGGPLDTLNDIRHGTRATGSQDLDSVDVGLLGNTVLLASNSTRAVSSVAVAVNVVVTLGNSLSPASTAFKVDVLDVGTGVNDVGIDTLTTIGSVDVLVECAEVELLTVRDTSQTPGSTVLSGSLEGVDFGVPLNIFNLHDRSVYWRVKKSKKEQRRIWGCGWQLFESSLSLVVELTSGCLRTCSMTSSSKWPE